MKKIIAIFSIVSIFCLQSLPAFALTVGTYKTETEYGLIDGFKFNWKRTDKSKPFVEPRESSTKTELEKEHQYLKDTEYERTKYMYEGTSIL